MEKRKISIYVGVIFLVLGIFWALSVLSNIVGTVYFLNKSIRTEGKILDKAWKSHDRSGDVYFFKVSFGTIFKSNIRIETLMKLRIPDNLIEFSLRR